MLQLMIQQQTAVDVKRKYRGAADKCFPATRRRDRRQVSPGRALAISERAKSLRRGTGVVLRTEVQAASAIVWMPAEPMGLPGPQPVATFLGDQADG